MSPLETHFAAIDEHTFLIDPRRFAEAAGRFSLQPILESEESAFHREGIPASFHQALIHRTVKPSYGIPPKAWW